jgi:hypothetical protein
MNIQIYCKYDKLVDPKKLKNHPKNRNRHGQDQVQRLADILKYQGWRKAIVVSKRSGYITSGHCRKMSSILLGLKEVPVVYQDYLDDAHEISDLTADNAIAFWSDLDMAGINADIVDLGPDYNIDMLGIHGFTLDVSEKETKQDESDSESESSSGKECPHCGELI